MKSVIKAVIAVVVFAGAAGAETRWNADVFAKKATKAAADSQVIKCQDGKAYLEIDLKLQNNAVASAQVFFWGKDLTPGLYNGQKLGSYDTYIFDEPANSGLKGIVGGGTDPSADDPYTFHISLPKEIIGKEAKQGAFKLYFDYRESYGSYSGTAQDLYNKLNAGGYMGDPAASSSQWGGSCLSYLGEGSGYGL